MPKQKVGFYFILPWLVGLIAFTIVPMLIALYISMTNWSIIGSAEFVGLANFKRIFEEGMFYETLWITVRYALLAVPMTIATAFIVAIFLNNNLRFIGIYRTIFYMPAIVSGVAVAIVFKWVLDPNYGVINSLLANFGIDGPNWLYDPNWVLPSYLIMAVWGASGGLLTYLVGLKDIPRSLYESADLDGANFLQKVRHVTMPMMTPIIFYNMIMGIIGAFRKFTDAYVLGGAGNQGKFYMVYLYEEAFAFYNMGYATALAWVLFVIILTLTIIINISKKYWVHT
ncbi:multiple sugar transport system permease protein [Amphibacillus marinus]|uniref:Multiple sugar transport system permease protein n=1 Tax=Amphibacillus marinus TaxID=872970 RepID=A0A1H8QCY9_9BACI|nr:sugar ABC transporter permease [Amphibacillus marinus]SEO51777.1 multiple sugar transport system permease protein [Amphibacillus marinus]